jgi:predicted nucleic acid-binding Zn ribbon protein
MNKILKCQDCGRSFWGYPTRKYCDSCRYERQREANRRTQQRMYRGETRKIGSIDLCKNCGEPYTVRSGNHMYCDECAPKMWAQHDREEGLRYYHENKGEINLKRNESRREKTREHRRCAVCGKPLTNLIGGKVTCSEECRRIRKNQLWLKRSHEKKRTEAIVDS